MIRVKLGAIYHYGIFVSEEEVIQFGLPPTLRELDKDHIAVIATDLKTFSNGNEVEVGVDNNSVYSKQEIIARARNRLGEEGYNILHNNCEHFAYECCTGKHYSSQEEILQKMAKEKLGKK